MEASVYFFFHCALHLLPPVCFLALSNYCYAYQENKGRILFSWQREAKIPKVEVNILK